jgi:hypothetical protein
MALTETQINQNIDAAFRDAAGYDATEVGVFVVTIVFVALYTWAAWGSIGSFLKLSSGSASGGSFVVAMGLIIAVLLIGTYLITQ